ncbi:MAG: 2-iminobutanoate/2-iminopropanoate deaminase [Gammaproteobacteria bacterium]|jgi:2-iminobutanoate/2-iminopropanoate deaminase
MYKPQFAVLTLLMSFAVLPSCRSSATQHRTAEGAIGPYSATVSAGGFHFLSGKIGEQGGTFAEEAESAIERIEQELAHSELSLADVVSTIVYLTDMGRYEEFNGIYARRFPSPYPARTCVAVAALPAAARVEVAVIARAR